MAVNSDLPGLLRNPSETLDVELKQWMDPHDPLTRATFAKELIALRNHGGGYLIIGFLDTTPPRPDPGRQQDISAFSTDYFNNVVKKYAEPVFHCASNIVEHPVTGELFPIVSVPGGSTVPVRCRADSSDGGKTIRINTYYIRRPGPESNSPQSGAEWDQLLNRCLLARKQELAAMFSTILSSGQVPTAGLLEKSEPKEPFAELRAFAARAISRFDELKQTLPANDPARLERGRFEFSARIVGDIQATTVAKVRDVLSGLEKYTGWSPMYVFTREPLAPYEFDDDTLECWLGQESRDSGHADFWRVSRAGFVTLIRGYQEDDPEAAKAKGFGKVMDLTIPAWRLAEFLLRVREFGTRLAGPSFKLQVIAKWTGLDGRSLVSWDRTRLLGEGYTARVDSYEASAEFDADQLDAAPAVIVGNLVAPLLRKFSFFEPPAGFFEAEISRMTSRGVAIY